MNTGLIRKRLVVRFAGIVVSRRDVGRVLEEVAICSEKIGLVVRGLLNKQAGSELGISEITVKAHRGRVM